ncbi:MULTISPECIES: CPBP family intramembrane glutamic endopeptidase [unclassified Rhodococcus (in: high G+C Gram-positive bacteria)]|uniref:CPBP family intramembrane glutamic endopeptidase n=1 Tax=unclassified Rhodococcus (in: high G+C Gram-positive bacteria) TaxID=192944 RepID=UPI00163A209F|nr:MULTISPECIES: CPBP family intramembrane glutamic endopeptidase [unclassified Rhodococcus (in: high G+C Gram-positive bacteria)]MBC2639869.1 CPBP family intramembrane metalloprotease [Rhodococcus sp. 3A]MBC2895385.1 CPBP family intramembrane metalloprotease [Rhodococcus sp. 4CII]
MSRPASVAAAAAALVWNDVVLPRSGLGPYGRAAAGGALGLSAVGAARAAGYGVDELGLSVSAVRSGLRYGAAASVVPIAGYAIALSIPALRARMPTGDDATGVVGWVGFRIPVGTVTHEELVFRSVLSAMFRRAWPAAAADALHATTFGLWHVRAARIAGDSVVASVLFTGASAWLFEWLRRRSGSVAAPALLHLSVNVGGAVAAEVARARTVD